MACRITDSGFILKGFQQKGINGHRFVSLYPTGASCLKLDTGITNVYMILYNFYRNAVFVLVLFWYALFTAFTLSTAINEWSSVLYSVIYTAVPTIVVRILDKDVGKTYLLKYPQLYGSGLRQESYNGKLFWLTMADMLWQSIVIFFVPLLAYWKTDIDGSRIGDLWTLAVVFLVNIHLAMDVTTWNWIIHASIWGSNIATIICVIIIDAIPILP